MSKMLCMKTIKAQDGIELFTKGKEYERDCITRGIGLIYDNNDFPQNCFPDSWGRNFKESAKQLKKFVCVRQFHGRLTVGKVYEVNQNYPDGMFAINDDFDYSLCVDDIKANLFKEYVEPEARKAVESRPKCCCGSEPETFKPVENLKKVVCVIPELNLTPNKVYDVIRTFPDGGFEIITDWGGTYYGFFGTADSHFKAYVEPEPQVSTTIEPASVTIEVPDGYKIKSQKIVDNQIVVELEPELNLVVVNTSDTVLKVKPEYLEKLKALGVYDQWLANVKVQYGAYGRNISVVEFSDLIGKLFAWGDTPERTSFWRNIALK